MTKRCIILNPWAGRGNAGQRRADIELAMRNADLPFDLITTHARGGATELAYQLIERGYDQIIAVGGDGTINEIVNGIIGFRESNSAGDEQLPALALIPLGTGSDFAKALNDFIPNDIDGAVRRIAAERRHSVDVGRITVEAGSQEVSRYFINGLGMGLDAQVAVESLKLTKLKGFSVYLVAIIRALARYKAQTMTVRFDDYEVRRKLLFASVANGVCQGGGFWITPDARIDDGMLDLCMIDNMRLDQIIRHIPHLMEGTHTQLRQATMGRARHVTVTTGAPIPVATDGEVIATDARRVEVEVLPHTIEILW